MRGKGQILHPPLRTPSKSGSAIACVEIPSPRYARLKSFTNLLISRRSDKSYMRFDHVCVHTIRYDTRCYFNVRSKADISQLNLPHGTERGLASGCISARKNRWMVIQRRQWRQLEGHSADGNGRGAKQLGDGRPGGCVVGSHKAWRVFVSVFIVFCIIVIIVKKLSSLKHLVTTTVAESHN